MSPSSRQLRPRTKLTQSDQQTGEQSPNEDQMTAVLSRNCRYMTLPLSSTRVRFTPVSSTVNTQIVAKSAADTIVRSQVACV
ncbi:hypothetical protein M758_UG088400 [Ceratodon purpureus]|nr:hypothetical protein M758_UG088400 [Ceratodon purpureus]